MPDDTYKLSENAGDDTITDLAGDELFFITKDPTGTPQTKLVTWDTLKDLVLSAAADEAEDAIADAIAALAPNPFSIGLTFLADTSLTTDADPGAGNFRWNHATQASATVVYVDDVTHGGGASLTGIWAALIGGGFLYAQHPADAAIWSINLATAIVDASGYAKLSITRLAGEGSFAHNDPMLVTIEQGATAGGVTSVNGASGAVVIHAFAQVMLSNMTTDLTTGTKKAVWWAPEDGQLVDVWFAVDDPSSSGVVRIDMNDSGGSVFTTRPSIDATESTSLTGTAAVLDGTISFAKGDKFTFDIDDAGTDAKGLMVTVEYAPT